MLFGRWGRGSNLLHYIGWWGLLSLVNLHLLGSSFARTMLLERGISNWRRRLVISRRGGIGRRLHPFLGAPNFAAAARPFRRLEAFSALADYARQILQSGPLLWLLTPFRWAVDPLFADGGREFLIALAPLLG